MRSAAATVSTYQQFNARTTGETIVFPRAEMVAATNEILTDNGIRSQGSPDILKIWETKP